MRRNFCFKLFFLVFSFFLCITCANAKECTTKELKELKQLAKNVDFGYTFNQENGTFEIFAYNFLNKFYIDSSITGFTNYENPVQSLGKFTGGFSADVVVYASSKTNCYESKLAKFIIEIPYYNHYSTNDECSIYKEFNLCKKWFDTSNITEEDFEKELEKYKLNLLKQDNDKNFFDVILSFILKNYLLFLGGFIIITLIVLFNLYLKKKKTNKIDFGD